MSTPSDYFAQEKLRTRATEALELARGVLQDQETPSRLVEYYDPDDYYVGATFAGLEPNDVGAVTATDLFAVSMMDIDFNNFEIRRFEASQDRTKELLTELPKRPLEEAEDADLLGPMADFYDSVKNVLAPSHVRRSNRWVAASKIAARKRPDLFPVRDRVVCGLLGILPNNDRAKDWYVFRQIMRDEGIRDLLAQLPRQIKEAAQRVGGVEPVIDDIPLRLLDAALWTFGRDPDNT